MKMTKKNWLATVAAGISLCSLVGLALAQVSASNLQYSGGAPVLVATKAYLVLWGFNATNDPQGQAPRVQALLRGLVGGAKEISSVTQYYQVTPGNVQTDIGDIASVTVVNDNSSPPSAGTTIDNWNTLIANKALQIATAQGVNRDPNTLIVVMTPQRAAGDYPMAIRPGWCARHGSIANAGANPDPAVAYIDLPYQAGVYAQLGGGCYVFAGATTNDGIDAVTIHELGEAITDPRYNIPGQIAWVGTANDENADKCQNGNGVNATPIPRLAKLEDDLTVPNQFRIPAMWSNNTIDDSTGNSGRCMTSYTRRSFVFHVGAHGELGYLPFHDRTSGGDFVTGVSTPFAGPFGAASWGPGRLDIFGLDTASPPHLRHAFSSNGMTTIGFDDWGSMTSPINKKVSASSWGPQHLDIFAVDGTLNALRKRTWNLGSDSGWTSWGNPTGITLASGPAAASPNFNRNDVFVLSNQSPPHLWHRYHDSGVSPSDGWDDWGAPSSGTLASDPAVATWTNFGSGPAGRYDIFIRTTQGTIAHRYWDNSNGLVQGWDDWGAPPGTTLAATPPTVVSTGELRLQLYVFASGALWRRDWEFGDRGWTQVVFTSVGAPASATW
jgi:hypothetical protein